MTSRRVGVTSRRVGVSQHSTARRGPSPCSACSSKSLSSASWSDTRWRSSSIATDVRWLASSRSALSPVSHQPASRAILVIMTIPAQWWHTNIYFMLAISNVNPCCLYCTRPRIAWIHPYHMTTFSYAANIPICYV